MYRKCIRFSFARLHRGHATVVHIILEVVPSNHDSDHNMGTHHCIQVEGCFLPYLMHSIEGALVGWKVSHDDLYKSVTS